jgi:hypothetical protein
MVTAREWTGGDNQYLVSPEAQQNLIRGINQFLAQTILRIWNSENGQEITRITKELTAEMYSHDRDMVVLESRKLTFGDTLNLSYRCTNSECRQQNSFDVMLNDIEVRYAESFPPVIEYTVTLDSGFPSPPTLSEPEGAESFKDVIMTYLTAKEDERVLQQARINQIKAESFLLYCSIKDIPGFDMTRKHVSMVEKLKAIDYRELKTAMNENRLGPDLGVEAVCFNCNTAVTLPLGLQLFSTMA